MSTKEIIDSELYMTDLDKILNEGTQERVRIQVWAKDVTVDEKTGFPINITVEVVQCEYGLRGFKGYIEPKVLATIDLVPKDQV